MNDNLAVRIAKFKTALQIAEQEFGITVSSTLEYRQYGESIMVSPVLSLIPMPGWTPPEPETTIQVKELSND